MDKKIVAIHQPNFLPWLGYFHKIANCDLFVLLDDVEFSKNSFINRNRIKTSQGTQWITLPVKYSGRSDQKIQDCEIDGLLRSTAKILKTIKSNYARSPKFDKYYPDLEKVLSTDDPNLFMLNEQLISWAMQQLNITTPLLRSSQLSISNLSGTDRLIAICQACKATDYLAGFGGKKYQEESKFQAAGIRLSTSDFEHPVYEQLWGDFESKLSVIDWLMNGG